MVVTVHGGSNPSQLRSTPAGTALTSASTWHLKTFVRHTQAKIVGQGKPTAAPSVYGLSRPASAVYPRL